MSGSDGRPPAARGPARPPTPASRSGGPPTPGGSAHLPAPSGSARLGSERWRAAIEGYDLEGELARGGMGVVYRGRHRATGEPVAIKLLLAGREGSPKQRERFAREVAALVRLRHPGIVGVRDAGEALGCPYMALELVVGETLQARLAREGALEVRRAASLVADLAQAVGHAHAHGVLHRDLKPDNVLLGPDGRPRLTDFGLARDLDASLSGTRLSVQGCFMGTPGYWSPEQALGRLEAIGPRTDVFGLGAVLYATLTGDAPATGTSIQALAEAVTRPPRLPSEVRGSRVDDALEAICLRCLERDPDERYAAAAEVEADLRRYLAGQVPEALRRRRGDRRRRRALAAIGGLLGVSLALATGVALVLHGRRDRGPERGEVEAALAEGQDLEGRGWSAGPGERALAARVTELQARARAQAELPDDVTLLLPRLEGLRQLLIGRAGLAALAEGEVREARGALAALTAAEPPSGPGVGELRALVGDLGDALRAGLAATAGGEEPVRAAALLRGPIDRWPDRAELRAWRLELLLDSEAPGPTVARELEGLAEAGLLARLSRRLRGRALAAAGRWAEVRSLAAEPALERETRGLLLYLLGLEDLATRPAAARDAFVEAAEAAPEDPLRETARRAVAAEAQRRLELLSVERRDPSVVRDLSHLMALYRALLALDPDPEPAWLEAFEAYFATLATPALWMYVLEQIEPSAGLALFEDILTLVPDDLTTLQTFTLFFTSKVEGAELVPRYRPWFERGARVAREAAERGAAEWAAYGQALQRLATILSWSGDLEGLEEVAAAARAEERVPRHQAAMVIRRVAVFHLIHGRDAPGQERLEAAAALDPDDVKIRTDLIGLHVRRWRTSGDAEARDRLAREAASIVEDAPVRPFAVAENDIGPESSLLTAPHYAQIAGQGAVAEAEGGRRSRGRQLIERGLQVLAPAGAELAGLRLKWLLEDGAAAEEVAAALEDTLSRSVFEFERRDRLRSNGQETHDLKRVEARHRLLPQLRERWEDGDRRAFAAAVDRFLGGFPF